MGAGYGELPASAGVAAGASVAWNCKPPIHPPIARLIF